MIPAEIKKSLIYVLETTYCSNVFMDGLYLTKKKVTSQQPRGKGVQRGRAALYKIALAILYFDSAFFEKF
jgi:hypothetical protein